MGTITGLSFPLSDVQREFLIDHIDGLRSFTDMPNEDRTRLSLVHLELISFHPPMSQTSRPRGTKLTDRGRETLCYVLGYMADQLHRAQQATGITTPVGPAAWIDRGGRGYGYWRDCLAAMKKQEQDNGQKIEGENHERREQV